eukprot:IDg3288t1
MFDEDRTKFKSKEAINGIIAGLRWVYRDAGHIDTWNIRISETDEKLAHGNPLKGSSIIKDLRKMFSKKRAEAGMRYDEAIKRKMDLLKCTKYGVELGILDRTKNSTSFRKGDSDGFLFCNAVGSSSLQLTHHEPWARKSFTKLMQERFTEIGIGSKNDRAHTEHRDGAYLRYTEGFNDLDGIMVPDFCSIGDLMAHADSRQELDKILDEEDITRIS